MASVTFDHITKQFQDSVAVKDLTMEIADNEFLVLVGPSGCGKSTTLGCWPASIRSRRGASSSATGW